MPQLASAHLLGLLIISVYGLREDPWYIWTRYDICAMPVSFTVDIVRLWSIWQSVFAYRKPQKTSWSKPVNLIRRAVCLTDQQRLKNAATPLRRLTKDLPAG